MSADPLARVTDGPAQLVEVQRTLRKKESKECALLLLSLSIPHVQARDGQAFLTLVPALHAERALDELSDYRDDNEGWPPVEKAFKPVASGYEGAAIYVTVLISLYILQTSGGFGLDWRGAGKTHAAAILDGEWWRTFTALGLHSGMDHLVGNLFFGVLYGVLLAHLIGNGLGWFVIVLAGGAGNALNAVIRDPGHTSIGASTAVFGALGALAAASWFRRRRVRSRRRWLPLFFGLVMLGHYGGFAEFGAPKDQQSNVDITAHATGFLAGFVLAALVALLLNERRPSLGVQIAAGLGALGLVGLPWFLAHTAG